MTETIAAPAAAARAPLGLAARVVGVLTAARAACARLISLSIGLAVLYRQRTAPIGSSVAGTYVAIGFIVAAVKTALSGA